MNALSWIEASNQYESLAVGLRCAMSAMGRDRTYEELLAALGLGSAVVATPDDTLGWWNAYARDTALADVAALYGVRLRGLHPPDAALGLRHSAEFAQHFRDSYIPLIQRALDHGQAVLAWRGWPPPRDRMWGLISEIRRDMVIGYTMWHKGQILPLMGPAHQIYVVEACEPDTAPPTASALFALAAKHAVAQWDGTWSAQPGLLTGRAAYDAWRRELAEPTAAFDRALPLHRQQIQAVRPLCSARRHLATWLRKISPALGTQTLPLVARWATACDRIGELLAAYESPESVKEQLATPDGVEHACDTLGQACKLEADIVQQLRDQV